MGIFFCNYDNFSCRLCGSKFNLTGEHKIKASLLRKEFGSEKMFIGSFDTDVGRFKPAQSVKSKALQFSIKICDECNSARTQPADREFHNFHVKIRDALESTEGLGCIFERFGYDIGSDKYLNIFRYFAKILCCQLSESGGPTRRHMANFALGRNSTNCIWLRIDRDWNYQQLKSSINIDMYAAHGGLVVYADKNTFAPNAFHSTLTFGPVRYVFFSRLIKLEQLELRLLHREFYNWCRATARETPNGQISENDRLSLGL